MTLDEPRYFLTKWYFPLHLCIWRIEDKDKPEQVSLSLQIASVTMFVVIRLPRLYRVHIESEPYMISQDGLTCCFRYNRDYIYDFFFFY